MFPVYTNSFEALPLEQFVTHLYFHDGIAIVRDCCGMHQIAPSRQIYRAVENRTSELRAAGYRTLIRMDVGMIHIYEPSARKEYHLDKYGSFGPVLAAFIGMLALFLFILEKIKWGF